MSLLTQDQLDKIWTDLKAPWDDPRALQKIKREDGTTFFVIRFGWVIERLNTVLGLGHWRVIEQHTSVTPVENGVEGTNHILFEIGNWHFIEGVNVWETLAQAPAYGTYIAPTPGDAQKASLTNAIKKAAAFFGPGIEAIKGITDDDLAQSPISGVLSLRSGLIKLQSNDINKFDGQGQIDGTDYVIHAFGDVADQLLHLYEAHQTTTIQGLKQADHHHVQITSITSPESPDTLTPKADTDADADAAETPSPMPDVPSEPVVPATHPDTSPATPSGTATSTLTEARAKKILEAEQNATAAGLDVKTLAAYFAPKGQWRNDEDAHQYYVTLITLTTIKNHSPELVAQRVKGLAAYQTWVKSLHAYGWNTDDALSPLVSLIKDDESLNELAPDTYQEAALTLAHKFQASFSKSA